MSTPPTVPDFHETAWTSSPTQHILRRQRVPSQPQPYDTYSESSTQSKKSDARRSLVKIECEYCHKALSSNRNRRLHLNVCKLSPMRHSLSFECHLCPEWRGFSEQARTEHFKSKLHRARAEEADIQTRIHTDLLANASFIPPASWTFMEKQSDSSRVNHAADQHLAGDCQEGYFELRSSFFEPIAPPAAEVGSLSDKATQQLYLDFHAAELLLSLSRCS
eukprot:TRINITY_DN1914_c0_g1_i1.p1 TRINITY_DN1914_c0_g1~~TRINITY_DN1914_c0_g1_i1.p1  ORF type:complete len:220 (+),score=28.88 TRINITY_DN1914_c0_g1_i1:74-733(+)